MGVKVSRLAHHKTTTEKRLFPFETLAPGDISYRGYPTDGGQTMKRTGRWKVQLVPPGAAIPSEPMPAFPDLSGLRMSNDGSYKLQAFAPLNRAEKKYNSGQAWVTGDMPTSEYYYAAAAPEDSFGQTIKRADHAYRIDKNKHDAPHDGDGQSGTVESRWALMYATSPQAYRVPLKRNSPV